MLSSFMTNKEFLASIPDACIQESHLTRALYKRLEDLVYPDKTSPREAQLASQNLRKMVPE
jgi:hypothetical protein